MTISHLICYSLGLSRDKVEAIIERFLPDQHSGRSTSPFTSIEALSAFQISLRIIPSPSYLDRQPATFHSWGIS